MKTPEQFRAELAVAMRDLGFDDFEVHPEALADMDPNGDNIGSVVVWRAGENKRGVFACESYVVALEGGERERGARCPFPAGHVSAALAVVIAEANLIGWAWPTKAQPHGESLARDDARARSRLSVNERVGEREDEDERRQ